MFLRDPAGRRFIMFVTIAGAAILAFFGIHGPSPAYASGCYGFVQTSTTSNTVANWTSINSSKTNGQPNMLVFATPVFAPDQVYDNHPTGVFYTGSTWAVFNEDRAAMPIGASFNINVTLPKLGPQESAFTQIATASNISGDSTQINNLTANNDPNAVMIVTQNYTPNAIYNNHTIGVYYTGTTWAIFNEDKTPMTLGASFNVNVLSGPTLGYDFIQTATAANKDSDLTFINNPYINGNSSQYFLQVTPNWGTGIYSNHNIGVFFNPYKSGTFSQEWGIFNEDQTSIPLNAEYNVFSVCG